jgi:hypothetical protein
MADLLLGDPAEAEAVIRHRPLEDPRALREQLGIGAARHGASQGLHEPVDPAPQLVARRPKGVEALRLGAPDEARVGDRPVDDVPGAGPGGAVGRGGVADGDDQVELLRRILLRGLRLGLFDRHAELGDREDRERVDEARRAGARGQRLDHVAVVDARERLRHLTARRVAGAEKQDPLLLGVHPNPSESIVPRRGDPGRCAGPLPVSVR